MSQRERLILFVKRQLELVPPATLFNLRHVDVANGLQDIIEKFTPPKERANLNDVARDMANEMMERARDVAKASSHIAKFTISACVSKGKGSGAAERRASFPFTLRGEAFEGLARDEGGAPRGYGESEPPTTAGVTAQLMRHLEATNRSHNEIHMAMFEGILRENSRLQDRNKKLEDSWDEARDAREELLDGSIERKLKLRQAELEEERKTHLLGVASKEFMPHLAKYAPMLIEKFLLPEAAKTIAQGAMGAAKPANGTPSAPPPPAEEVTPAPEASQKSEADQKLEEIADILRAIPQEEQIKLLEKLPEEKAMRLLTLLGVT